MLSRVADSLYWLGRYTERAENYARFIDVNFNLTIDLPTGIKEQWDPLITATGDRELFTKLYGAKFTRQNAIYFLAFDEENPNSLLSSIVKARENARIVRETITNELWEILNELYYYSQNLYKQKIWKREDPKDIFKQIKYKLQLLNGISYNTLPRTQAWFFMKIGQYLERADKTSRILDVKYHFLLPSADEVGSPLDFLHWTALLKSVSGFNAYRKVYGKISPTNIVEYLVLDHYFPRSILFCLTHAENSLREISEAKHGYSNPVEKSIGNLRAHLEFADINDVFNYGLHEYLDNLQIKLNDISIAITSQYFEVQSNIISQSQQQE